MNKTYRLPFAVYCAMAAILSLMIFSSCNAEIKATPEEKSGVVKAFEDYWSRSSSENNEDVIELTTSRPTIFSICAGKTPAECDDSRKERAEREKQNAGKPKMKLSAGGTDPFKKIERAIPNWIKNKQWVSYKILKESVVGNEAKLTIELTKKKLVENHDVFLYKEKDGWKIFEIELSGVYEGYAETATAKTDAD